MGSGLAILLIRFLSERPARMTVGVTIATGLPAPVNGDDVTRKKPDPEIYQVACERLDIPPGRTIVIEDAPAGIEAAKNAGAVAIAVTNSTAEEHLRKADLIVRSLSQLHLDVLRNLLRARAVA